MGFLEKLMLAKAISFKEGSIYLLDTRVVMPPADTFSEYTKRINDYPEQIYVLYESVKASFGGVIAKGVSNKYGFSVNDYFKWMTDISMFTGWGNLVWSDLEKDKKVGGLTVENSPVGTDLKGKVKSPVDHVIRGFIAGAVSAALKEDIDVFEVECIALGAPKCKFIFQPKENFQSYPRAKTQLRIES